ncbi:regulator of g protein signaling [Anaeramoeba ignava]|uniref:Regulator of g protein signaling n=1 Tax=Anaeramoeba ignava TaxID=1746090 RepID=A0A9Q0RD43_ANAIG|nr:regulator of g protein signaling [Anaeramoeba ignava]
MSTKKKTKQEKEQQKEQQKLEKQKLKEIRKQEKESKIRKRRQQREQIKQQKKAQQIQLMKKPSLRRFSSATDSRLINPKTEEEKAKKEERNSPDALVNPIIEYAMYSTFKTQTFNPERSAKSFLRQDPFVKEVDSDLDDFDPNVIPEEMSNFDQILNHDISLAYFQYFLCKQLSLENILFWKTAREYQEIIDPVERVGKIPDILNKFVKTGSQYEINIDSTTRQKILQNINDGIISQDLFDEAIDAIKRLMEIDSFAKFKKSDSYKALILDWHRIHTGNEPRGPETARDEIFNRLYYYEQAFIEKLSMFSDFIIKPLSLEIGTSIQQETFDLIFKPISDIYTMNKLLFSKTRRSQNEMELSKLHWRCFFGIYFRIQRKLSWLC